MVFGHGLLAVAVVPAFGTASCPSLDAPPLLVDNFALILLTTAGVDEVAAVTALLVLISTGTGLDRSLVLKSPQAELQGSLLDDGIADVATAELL